jgi:RHS repeat-associated protein
MSYLSSTYTYDQENRLSSTAGTTYTYDGNGERVLKFNTSTGAAVKRYWSMGGNTLAEGDGSGNLTAEYVYFNGKRIARIDLPANTVHYYLSDHLGSTSLVVSSAGTVEEESDYYPFGTEIAVTGPGTNELKFTGKRRDTESQLDYFGARHYANWTGRFLSADQIYFQASMMRDPQRFNLYAYVRNNPLIFIDPKGEAIKLPNDQAAREKALAALKNAVGTQAGAHLYDNADKKTGNHYVGISGNHADFAKMNGAASDLATVTDSKQVAAISIVASGTTVHDDSNDSTTITPVNGVTGPAATGIMNGQVTIVMLDPDVDPGKLPGSVMSDGKDGYVDSGIILGHELGHAASIMGLFLQPAEPPNVEANSHNTNKMSLNFENRVRQNKDPNGPTRTKEFPQ